MAPDSLVQVHCLGASLYRLQKVNFQLGPNIRAAGIISGNSFVSTLKIKKFIKFVPCLLLESLTSGPLVLLFPELFRFPCIFPFFALPAWLGAIIFLSDVKPVVFIVRENCSPGIAAMVILERGRHKPILLVVAVPLLLV